MSRYGEIQLSVRRRYHTSIGDLSEYELMQTACFFAQLANRAHVALTLAGSGEGLVSGELLDVERRKLYVSRGNNSVDIGECAGRHVEAGDFECTPNQVGIDGTPGTFRGLAACICEFAIHFRDPRGSGLALDLGEIEKQILKEVGLRPAARQGNVAV